MIIKVTKNYSPCYRLKDKILLKFQGILIKFKNANINS